MFNALVQDIMSGIIEGQFIGGSASEQASRNLANAAAAAAAVVKQPTMPMQQNLPVPVMHNPLLAPHQPNYQQQQMPPQLFQNPSMYGPGTWPVSAAQNAPVAAPPAPVRPPPPQQQQPQRLIGFCYSCNRRVYVTQQKTCSACLGGFVELEEPSGLQYLPSAPLPAALPPVIERTPPPPPAMPPAIPVIPAAPVVRQKRQYNRRNTAANQVQVAAATVAAGPANPYAQTPGMHYTNITTLQAAPPVNAPRPTASYATTNSIAPTTSETAKRKEPGAKTPTKRQRKNATPTKDAAHEAAKENSPCREEYECKICFEAQSDCVFLGCSHMCACYKCGLNIHQMKGECPICRKPIEKVILVFRA